MPGPSLVAIRVKSPLPATPAASTDVAVAPATIIFKNMNKPTK